MTYDTEKQNKKIDECSVLRERASSRHKGEGKKHHLRTVRILEFRAEHHHPGTAAEPVYVFCIIPYDTAVTIVPSEYGSTIPE